MFSKFNPDFAIAQSRLRFSNGNPEPHDITLITHEIMEKNRISNGLTQDEAHTITSKTYNYQKEVSDFMIHLKDVKKVNGRIQAMYYPENSKKGSLISINLNDLEDFKGSLVGAELESDGHLGHAKWALQDMVEGKREIKDCTIMWF